MEKCTQNNVIMHKENIMVPKICVCVILFIYVFNYLLFFYLLNIIVFVVLALCRSRIIRNDIIT